MAKLLVLKCEYVLLLYDYDCCRTNKQNEDVTWVFSLFPDISN